MANPEKPYEVTLFDFRRRLRTLLCDHVVLRGMRLIITNYGRPWVRVEPIPAAPEEGQANAPQAELAAQPGRLVVDPSEKTPAETPEKLGKNPTKTPKSAGNRAKSTRGRPRKSL